MKNQAYLILIVSLLLVFSGIIFNLARQNKILKSQLTSLALGQSIDYFDLVDMNETVIDKSVLNREKGSLIFIFSRPCSICNANTIFWNRMAEISKDDVEVFGIVLDDFPQVLALSKNKKINFNLFVPANIERFIGEFRVYSNQAHSILYYNGKVESIAVGELSGESYTEMMRKVKRIVRKKKPGV